MPSTNQFVADDFIAHAVDLQRYTASERKKVLRMLRDLEKNLVNEVRAAGFDEVKATSYKVARLEKTLTQTRATISTAYKRINKDQRESLRELAAFEETATKEIINSNIGVSTMNVALSPEQLRILADETLIDAAPTRTWWRTQDTNLTRRFSESIRQGVLAGETNQELVQRIRGTRAMGYTNGVMNTSRHHAEALVRSSVQTVSNRAREASFLANSDVVKGVQQLSTLDAKTTNTCKAYDGKAWTIRETGGRPEYIPDGHSLPFVSTDNNGVTHHGPPRHWNCRSTITSILKSWEELANQPIRTPDGGTAKNIDTLFTNQLKKQGMSTKDANKVKANSRASMDGAVPETMDYDEWLVKQIETGRETRAIEALGQGRYDLFREGKITSTTQLVDQTGRELSLDELYAKYGMVKKKPPTPAPPKVEPVPDTPRMVLPPDEPAEAVSWHDRAWSVEDTPDDIKAMVANVPPLHGGVTYHTNSGAYYQPLDAAINMHKSGWSGTIGTWRHEYGHRLDHVIGLRSKIGERGHFHQGTAATWFSHVDVDNKQIMKWVRQAEDSRLNYDRPEFNLVRAIDAMGPENRNKKLKIQFIEEWLDEVDKLEAWKAGFNNIPKAQRTDPRRLAYLAREFRNTDMETMTKEFVTAANKKHRKIPVPNQTWVTEVGKKVNDPFFKGEASVADVKEQLNVLLGEAGVPVTADDLLTLTQIKNPTTNDMRGIVRLGEALGNRDAHSFLGTLQANLDTGALLESDFRGTWRDFFGAITNNKVGGGHSTAYYKRSTSWMYEESGNAMLGKVPEYRTGESFAQWIALRSWENGRGRVNEEIIKWFTPNLHRGYTDITKKYLIDWSE